MKGVKEFNYGDLYNFLLIPRTLQELKNRYNTEANRIYWVITNASFLMPLYEGYEKGVLYYGINTEYKNFRTNF